MATCDVDALLAEAKESRICCLNMQQKQVLMIQLLCEIYNAGGGGGGGTGGVLCGLLDPPVADPGVNCAVYYHLSNGKMWQWNDPAGTWDQTL